MTYVVELVNVARHYPGPPPVHALSSATLQVERGEFVAVTGPSGSGKSTLLNVLGLLDRPSSGSYRIAGTDTADMSDTERAGIRASMIGFVFQAFHLLPHRSALHNVMLSGMFTGVSRHTRREQSRAALDGVGLAHRHDAFPTTLSGGERQRVAIARALANRPHLLLCDEPTGNLDSRNADVVLDLLATLHQRGQTIIVITHSDVVARAASRQVTILDGVLADG